MHNKTNLWTRNYNRLLKKCTTQFIFCFFHLNNENIICDISSVRRVILLEINGGLLIVFVITIKKIK